MKVGRTSDEELEQIIQEGGRRGEIYAGLKSIREQVCRCDLQTLSHYPGACVCCGYNLDQLLPEHGFHVARRPSMLALKAPVWLSLRPQYACGL